MTITGPTDSRKLSDHIICPQCGNLLPPHALFCTSCGQRINRKQNEQRQAGSENGADDAQGQEDAILRIPLLLRTQMKHLQSYLSLNSSGRTLQNSIARFRHQDSEVSSFEELTAPPTPVPAEELSIPSTPVPDSETEKIGAVRLSDTESLSKRWGWFPVLSLVSALGVLLVALSYGMGRLEVPGGNLLFWCGLLVIFLPIAWRLLSLRAARRERIALLVILGFTLYFVKYLQYPLYFTYFDEFTHTRTTLDIIASGHLFHENPLLAISSWYPGLEIVASTLSILTGLSIFTSGILLIGLARLVFVLSLYLFYEQFTNSPRAAGIAAALYMANPNFLFFDADFSYESFALPLAVFILFAVALRCNGHMGRHKGLILAICLGLGAVVITHHVTSYVLVAFLLLWTAASFYQNRIRKDQVRPGPGGVALIGLILAVVWLTYTGDQAVPYLGQYFAKAWHQLMQILAGERATRQLFQNSVGFGLPLWERIIASTSVALILIGLPFGFFRIWRHHRANAVALALAGWALAYPAGQAIRWIPATAESGARTTEFTFLGVAFVLTIGATEFWLSCPSSLRRSMMIMGAVGIIFFGQMVLSTGAGGAPLPGPYIVAADVRSIEPEGITAAQWAGSYLGPGHRIATDRTNWLLMATYGDEQIVKAGGENKSIAQVFTSLHFGQTVAILQHDKIQYLVVDRRLSTALPSLGSYFDVPAKGPIDPAALAKFDRVQNVSRIFDSGDIQIYDVEAITSGSSASSTTSTPKPSCIVGSSTPASGSYPRVANLYRGTLYDISKGLSTNISLTGIQQERGDVCGYIGGMPKNAVSSGMPGNGPLKGTIATKGQIQFLVSGGARQATFSFNGVLLSDGTMTGSYCNSGTAAGKCTDYGLWSVSPAKSG